MRIEYTYDSTFGSLTLYCPQPLSSVAGLFHGLYWIKIYDRNRTGAMLNFGRFEVHLFDEDAPQYKMLCDRYEVE